MIDVSSDIHIEAPVADVYGYMDDPHNHAEVTPSITEVRNVQPLENGGKRPEYIRYRRHRFRRELEEVEHVEDERMVFEMHGELEGQITLTYEEEGRGTRLTYSADVRCTYQSA